MIVRSIGVEMPYVAVPSRPQDNLLDGTLGDRVARPGLGVSSEILPVCGQYFKSTFDY